LAAYLTNAAAGVECYEIPTCGVDEPYERSPPGRPAGEEGRGPECGVCKVCRAPSFTPGSGAVAR